VLQQAAQNTLLIGEETVPLHGLIKANGSRLLSTFDPFKLIGGSAIIYLPTSNISSSLSPSTSFSPSSASEGSDKMQILALDGNTNEMVILPSTKMPALESSTQGSEFNRYICPSVYNTYEK
jgi:hypothetical protein